MGKEVFSPSEPAENETRSSIRRVVGAQLSEEARQRILGEESERFKAQERPEWDRHEVAKTPEQMELLAFVDQATDRLLHEHGREAFHIPPDNHHLLDEEGRRKLGLRWESGGSYSIKDQAIFMRPVGDPVIFGLVAYHETLHFKSHQALQRLYPGKEVLPYRRGFEIVTRHGHRSYFRQLDEALIQELSNRFTRESLSEHPLTKDAVAASEDRRKLILQHADKLAEEDVEFLQELVPYIGELPEKARAAFSQADLPVEQARRAFTDCKHLNVLIHPYGERLRDLHLLVEEIYRRKGEQFANQEEVFELFVEAVVTGNVLPVGRVIDTTFGKGSFRRLGNGEQILDPSCAADESADEESAQE
jgi:hypothetical protein